jgi:hypothetical protein
MPRRMYYSIDVSFYVDTFTDGKKYTAVEISPSIIENPFYYDTHARNMRSTHNELFPERAFASAVVVPPDRYNREIGYAICLGKALIAYGEKILKRSEGLLKHKQDILAMQAKTTKKSTTRAKNSKKAKK